MVIVDRYRLLYLQTPRTGSTAVAKELKQSYGGREICFKHANYYSFLRTGVADPQQYLVVAGVRDPIESAYSKYRKYLSDHRGKFSRLETPGAATTLAQRRELRVFHFVRKTRSFGAYLQRYCRLPFVNHLAIHGRYCDEIIRFEQLQQDFKKIVARAGAEIQRPLPLINKTQKYEISPLQGLDPEQLEHCAAVFGPFMQQWGYPMPEVLAEHPVPSRSRMIYRWQKTSVRCSASLAARLGLSFPR